MKSRKERGEGQAGSLFFLVLLVAAGYATWNVAPAYLNHYDFIDKVNEICRTPRWKADDEKIHEMLMKEVRQRRLDDWISRNSFKVSTTETNRRISLKYEREVQVLPGFKKKLKFDFQSDQPLI
jgi:hypothetical protein